MKNALRLATAVCCVLCVALGARAEDASSNAEKELNVLFIGNSFTFFNSMNDTVQDMLNVAGFPTKAVRSAPGGWRFRQHFKGEVPEKYKGDPTPEVVASQKWDYVVLQEYSSGAVNNRAEFLEYGQKLAEMIRKNNPATKILLYQTWERCDGMFEGYGDDPERRDAVLKSWEKRYKAPDEKMIEALKDGIQGGYDELAKLTDSTVVPVGKGFLTVGDKYNLFCDEGDATPYHPNPLGTYLGGCMFFKTITGQSPVGLYEKLSQAGKKYKLTAEEAAYLEGVADQLVVLPE